ncbi:MAG: homocysteine S-methyltransferase family protein, partial [Muribaculaceae bacterium]|nr:homocysteine S-methyltransferase family protein [Muribaculaceae bacterium]
MTHSAKPIDSTLKSELTDELILILDGAMGTMIQTRQLDETDYRGNLFESHPHSLTGCNDILCITSPQTITDIHNEYISAGARIISTNTFNANAISMAEYGLQDYVEQINRAAVQCARKAIETSNKTHRIWIAGSIGPTNKSLSMTTLADQENEQLTFESLSDAYRSQAHALIDAGADTLLIETIFDTLNAKAAIAGSMQAMQQAGREVPIMLSVTLTETGRTLSGQTIDAFIASVSHCAPLSIGLNCGFGPEQLRHYLRQLSAYGIPVSFHPNAGLPDAFGNYALSPDDFASQIADAISGTNVRIIGGCCGTTPAHIHAIASHPKCAKAYPLQGPATTDLVLSGLESMHIPSHGKELTKIGERCNVAGSRKFLRLIKENNLDEAVSIAVSQVKAGAKILDINLDDGMLDAPYEMARFLNRIAADPVASAIPVMIDSSSWDVICKGLQHTQGKCIVNSISLKEGEDEFLQRACHIRQMGAAVVVMAMDEHGQAETYERKLEICKRAYSLLTGKTGFKPQEIIFDPNVLTIATGIQEHNNYAVEFIRAAEAIKDCMPGVHVSGGISNLSFAFRGIEMVRKAMHAEFISLAKGLDMAILNPSVSLNPSDFPSDVRNAVRDAILNTDPKATERLTAIAHEIKNETNSDKDNIIRHSAPT